LIQSQIYQRYLLIIASGALAFLLLVCAAMLRPASQNLTGLSDFARIPLLDRNIWYRDLGGRTVPEIQELDLFYHNIGSSIAEARKADIILLGPSFMLYAIDPEELRQFGEKHGLKIYNMAFFGVRSGEFSREIIERWSLHPKLWIINVDDNFDHFFSKALTMWWFISPKSVPIPPVDYDRMKGWASVARRNARWRLEDARAPFVPDHSIYRREDDGSVFLGNDPRFGAADNKTINVVREANCHATSESIKIGRDYLASIGGESIFTLVPNSTWCPTQAFELGKELGNEVILPPDANYSTVDNGGHLDHRSAVAFTRFLLTELEQSQTFRRSVSGRP
jgi:hypothetical protein